MQLKYYLFLQILCFFLFFFLMIYATSFNDCLFLHRVPLLPVEHTACLWMLTLIWQSADQVSVSTLQTYIKSLHMYLLYLYRSEYNSTTSALQKHGKTAQQKQYN